MKINRMNWKMHLRKLEDTQHWDEAIEFLQQIIKENPNDIDAYIFMNFLLVDLIIEEDYDHSKLATYKKLAKWYFDESYAKFSNNAEYLYFTAKTAVIGEWLFGIEQEDYQEMFEKAHQLEPNNFPYQEGYYYNLRNKNPKNPELIVYAKMILSDNSPIKEQLKNKGPIGEYILGMKEGWSKEVLWNAEQ